MDLEQQESVKLKLLKSLDEGLDELENLPLGSEERTTATENLVKLYKLKQEDEKLEVTSITQDELNEQKETERKDRQKQFWINTAIHVGEIVAAGAIYAGLAVIGYKYEETGSLTAATTRNAVKDANSFFRPGKKR